MSSNAFARSAVAATFDFWQTAPNGVTLAAKSANDRWRYYTLRDVVRLCTPLLICLSLAGCHKQPSQYDEIYDAYIGST